MSHQGFGSIPTRLADTADEPTRTTASDLERLAESGGSRLWLAERARGWLDYWQHDIGRQGFYPFDLLAAAYVVEPHQFRCAPVKVWVGEDPTLFVSFWRSTALLVGQSELSLENPRAIGSALYCAKAAAELKPKVMDRFKAAMVALPGQGVRRCFAGSDGFNRHHGGFSPALLG
jgi:hypothetical protein